MRTYFLPTGVTAPGSRAGVEIASLYIVFGLLAALVPAAEQPIELLEQRAFEQVWEHAAASVVRIETIGGLEQREGVLLPAGASTGTIVSADGLILTSVLPFLTQPAAVVVQFSDGTRLPARPLATDYSRLLVLLRVKPQKPLPVLPAMPKEDIRPGMWAIAVGWGYDSQQPGIATGVVSATNRLWGKALQTDVNTSPNNYGGPLVDIRGRLLGVVVPLSTSGSVLAGVQWYDSGIGFAVPADHLSAIIPRLARGEDLYPGTLGVRFPRGNPVLTEPIIAGVDAELPAAKAGLKPGDRIVSVNGDPVERVAQVLQAVGPLYAGDQVRLVIEREGKRSEKRLTLARPPGVAEKRRKAAE